MAKAENRAAAKAWHQERLKKMRDEARALAIAADLEELRRLRHYLIFQKKAGIPAMELIDSIDHYAGQLTGDRRALHGQPHSIGGR